MMKMPKYLSPSSLSTWLQNKDEFVLKYLVMERPPRIPQTKPMSVGSAFDAYAKSYLHQKLFGKVESGTQFDFDTLFQAQVEVQNRDFAMKAGAVAFIAYKESGALSELLQTLEKATAVEMEFTVNNDGQLLGQVENGPVLLGKPDLKYVFNDITVILDWKVNGYCANSPTSPKKGYIKCTDGWKLDRAKGSRGSGGSHKECIPSEEKGLVYNLENNIEIEEPSWARQLATYSWLVGVPVGCDNLLASIDQLCCSPSLPTPLIRVARHRCMISPYFQQEVYKQYDSLWKTILSGHIYQEMSREDSDARVKMLGEQHNVFKVEGSEKHDWLKNALRS